MKYSPYSFSRLSTHKQCPRKFKYNYIDAIQSEKTDRTALLKGGAVHSILEYYPNPSPHKLAEKFQSIVDKFIETNLGKKYLTAMGVREFDFGLQEDLSLCAYSDKKALLRGSVDFICTIDGMLHLLDYKSGSYKNPKFQSYEQLMFYAIYFFRRYPTINKIKISYVYVEHENTENSIILERQFLANYIHELINSIEVVESDELFVKNESKLCSYCQYKEHCASDKI